MQIGGVSSLPKAWRPFVYTSWQSFTQETRFSQTLAKKKETTISQMTSFVKALKA